MFNKHETKKLSLTLLLFFHELEKEKNARNRFTVFNELKSEKNARNDVLLFLTSSKMRRMLKLTFYCF